MRKCKSGWHLDDGKGYKGICSDCILRIPHPTLRRLQRKADQLRHKEPSYWDQRRLADYKQAASLLKDDLVWSGDFDNIRYELLQLIEQHIRAESFPDNLSEIVQKLISVENDLSI
jgi:hypothetical protein